MKQNKKCKQTLKSVQYGLEINFSVDAGQFWAETTKCPKIT